MKVGNTEEHGTKLELPAKRWADLNDATLWLHGQQDVPTLQKGVLQRLEQLIPHSASFFDLCYEDSGHLLFFDPVSLNMSPEDLDRYYQQYQDGDYVVWSFTSDAPIVYRDSDVIGAEVRTASRIYQEWLEPMGLNFGMGCTIVANGTIYGSITLFRSRSEPNFTGEEVSVLSVLSQHLATHFVLLHPSGISPDGSDTGIERISRDRALTKREKEILFLIVAGEPNRAIADRLFLSESTVKKHAGSLFRKLGVQNRGEALRLLYGTSVSAQR